MAISITLQKPQPVTSLTENPEKAQEDINQAIQLLQRNIELLKSKAKEE